MDSLNRIEITNHPHFFSKPAPKLTTLLQHIEVTGILDPFCEYKLGELINQYLRFSTNDENPSDVNTFKAMQIDAILFEIMQFMDRHAKLLKEAGLIRNALVHCRGVIASSLDEKTVKGLHEEVLNLANDLLSLKINPLMQNRLCQKLIGHGKSLTERREEIKDVDRTTANDQFKNKKKFYENYKSSACIGEMRRSALQMVHIHNNIYGLRNNPLVPWEDPIAIRHYDLFWAKKSWLHF